MAIFPRDPEEVYEMLDFLEHPREAFCRLSTISQVLLVVFIVLFYPIMLVLGLALEICWRVPWKCYHGSAFKPEKDLDYLQEFMTKESAIRNILVFLLHHEVRAAVNDHAQLAPYLHELKSIWMRPTRSWSTFRSQRPGEFLPDRTIVVVDPVFPA